MAAQLFNTAQRNAGTGTNNDQWKAQGFLNLYLPSRDGGRRKLGSIPLKQAKPAEAQLLEWLNEDPSRIGQLLAKLELDYQPAEGRASSGFDL